MKKLIGYCKKQGLNPDYVLAEAQSIIRELKSDGHISMYYIEEKMENIKRFMNRYGM
jgi:ABC-type branched-subunit amino acid transport system ATPase component